jgi:4-amino-4-deoxy-L-arabinose transferase-like glycosyltransferase
MALLSLLKEHRVFFIVLAFAAILFLSDIWIYKEFVRAESYFALGSCLMVEQGDWLTPHAPDELPLNKPPLTYWLIGISYKLFAASYGSARLPSVLAALLVLAIVYSLGVRLDGKRAGLISVAMLASSYLFLSFARMAMSDMLLTLCVTASLACFVIALTDHGSQSNALVLLGYVALALGVLTKGPVAVALVAVPIGLELVIRRNREDLRKLRLLPGLALFLLIGAPYFFLVYARLGAGPLRFFFFGENLQRFTGQLYGASGRPVWYELVAFFSDFAPWSLLIFVAFWFRWRGRAEQESKSARVLYLWLGCTIVLFSLSSFSLDYYLLPAMPASALIIAPVVANAEKLPHFLRRIVEAFLILCSVAILLIASLSLKAAALLSASTALRFLPVIVALVGLGLISVYLVRRKTWQATLVLTATMGTTILAMQCALLPSFARYLPATQLAASVPAESVLYTSSAASDWANSLAFNLPLPHRVERLIDDKTNERLLLVLKSDSKSVAVVRESEYSSLAAQDPVLKILAQAETFAHGGLSFNMIPAPRRERLLLIGHDR